MSRYFGFEDIYNQTDQQQKKIACDLYSNTQPVASFKDAVKLIGRHVYAKYKFFILNRRMNDTHDYYEDKKELLRVLPAIDSDTLQVIIDQMYNIGLVKKDDGITVYFTKEYVYSTSGKRYFDKL